MADPLTWEIARVGGLLGYALLTASVALGMALSLKVRSTRWPRFVTNELHRFVTLLALVFVGIHSLAVWIDPFTAFGPAEVLVPFVSHYRPLWIGLGIVAAYLMVAIWLSERIRPRIGYVWWRRFHGLSFAAFALATLHGLASGSDSRTPWAMLLYAGSLLLVTILLALRLWPEPPARSHPILATATIIGCMVVIVWAVVGPLQPGWNAIANNGQGSGAAATTQVAPP